MTDTEQITQLASRVLSNADPNDVVTAALDVCLAIGLALKEHGWAYVTGVGMDDRLSDKTLFGVDYHGGMTMAVGLATRLVDQLLHPEEEE